MILYTHDTSPFGRMVLLASNVLGLEDQLEVRGVSSRDPSDPIRQINPLGKMPALVVNKKVYYDSRVILEYLDFLSTDIKIFPLDKFDKFRVQTELSRAMGIMDAALLIVYERRLRPVEKIVESVIEYQRDKIIRCFHQINSEKIVYVNDSRPNAAEISLACSLDYLDLRQQLDWRDHAPILSLWLKIFASNVPGYLKTMPR